MKSGFPLYVVDLIGEGNVYSKLSAAGILVRLSGCAYWTGCLLEMTILATLFTQIHKVLKRRVDDNVATLNESNVPLGCTSGEFM